MSQLETKEAINTFAGEVQSQAEKKTGEKRRQIREEAAVALTEIKSALRALDEEKKDQALAALKRAFGTLGILLAREPDLKLAPVDVGVTVHDSYSDLEAIERDRVRAWNYLERKEVQKARELVAGMASEVVITVFNLSLAGYLGAIKEVVPLISEEKIEEAKAALQAALNTVVRVKHVVPLPVVRAEVSLKKAESLAEKTARSDEDNNEMFELLDKARWQLRMAQALGYGKKTDYERLYRQIDEIEQKTEGGRSGRGFFDSLRQSLADFW